MLYLVIFNALNDTEDMHSKHLTSVSCNSSRVVLKLILLTEVSQRPPQFRSLRFLKLPGIVFDVMSLIKDENCAANIDVHGVPNDRIY